MNTRMNSSVVILMAVLASLACVTNAVAETWHAGDDFARPGTANGNLGWWQGAVDTGGTFHAYTTSSWIDSGETIARWHTDHLPDTLCNTTANDIWWDNGELLVAPETVTVHPGAAWAGTANWDSDLRWTAPEEGDYLVDARMFGASRVNTNAVGYVLKNLDYNSPLAQTAIDGFVNSGGTELNYVDTVHLLAGDTLDFVVNIGAHEQPDNVGIQATITLIPEPSLLTFLGTGLAGLFAYTWRKRK